MFYRNYKLPIHLLALFVLTYLVVFVKLGSFHMRWWDESIFAVNTYEMLHNGKYFSKYFDGVIDLYQTKPPLLNWVQILFVKLFGYNELALRLPTAIASTLTVLLTFSFLAKRYSYLWGWISALVMLCSFGFIHFHTSRTADSDALLTMFLLLANLTFIKYLIDGRKKDVLVFFIFISLAFATKLHASLLFAPSYLIILLLNKKLKGFIVNWAFGFGVIILFTTGGLLIYLRELDAPGYLNEFLSVESNRFLSEIENHREPFNFYLNKLVTERFSQWSAFFLIGVFMVFSFKDKSEYMVLKSIVIMTLVYLLIISISVSKLEWDDMPLLAMISAYPIFWILKNVKVGDKPLSTKPIVFSIILIFAYPYLLMINKSQANTIKNGEKRLEVNERYLFERINDGVKLDGVKVYYHGYKGSLLFYKYKLKEQNQNIDLYYTNSFSNNDRVLVSNDSLKNFLAQNYHLQPIDSFDSAYLYQLNGKINK